MEERADAADRIMRILQDYDLVSGADMATYLQKTLKQIANTPMEASALFQASLSGITNASFQEEEFDDDGNFINNNNDLLGNNKNRNKNRNLSRAASTQGLMAGGGSKTQMSMQGKNHGKHCNLIQKVLFLHQHQQRWQENYVQVQQQVLEFQTNQNTWTWTKGIYTCCNENKRGRFAPIVMDDKTGILTDTGFRKLTMSNDGSLALSSPISSPTSSKKEIAEEIKLASRSKLPKGPLNMKSRAWMYNNMRGMIIEEDRQQSQTQLLRSRSGSIGSRRQSLSQSGKSALLGMSRGSITSSNGGEMMIAPSTIAGFNNSYFDDGRQTPWTATGMPRIENSAGKQIEDGWYPHMEPCQHQYP